MGHLFRHIPHIVLAGCIPACLTMYSCVYQYPDESCGLVPEADGVKVNFDWVNNPMPEPPGMSVYFYPTDGGDFYSYNLDRSGLAVNLPDGWYDAVSFNYDSENVIVISDASYSTIAFTTRPAKITDGLRQDYSGVRPPESREEVEGQTVINQPQYSWCATATDRHLTRGDSITLTPHNIVSRYRIVVNDITNLHSVSRMSLSLSGLAGQYHASSGIAPDEVPVILPGSVSPESENSISGVMLTFGRAPSVANNTLRLYLWLTDGEKKVYEWDVAEQIVSAPNQRQLTITVGGITLPDLTPVQPPEGEEGMKVDVDNWEVIDIELST